jgi:hypothetical protein
MSWSSGFQECGIRIPDFVASDGSVSEVLVGVVR